ncbi:MAG: DNA repair protein RecN [Acidimicrobiia bacterium]
MLTELRVENLGVIESIDVVLGAGMTALTGETGAGKTLLVEAIELLVGGRADPVLVRAGCDEARVEGRFVVCDDEIILARVVPRDGRSRAYVNGRLATVAVLAEEGARLLDLHGQHAHQSLLAAATQREALDKFGGVDLAPLRAAEAAIAEIDTAMKALGGDERSRAREIDLLRFQVDELSAADLDDPDEDGALEAEEDLLAGALAHREAAEVALAALGGDDAMLDTARSALAAIGNRAPFATVASRLRSLISDADEIVHDLRGQAEAIEDDPERLAEVRGRRKLLHDLRRKYGESMAEVIAYRDEVTGRLADLEAHDERFEALRQRRAGAVRHRESEAAKVAAARRAAAPGLAAAVQAHLATLAMAKARIEVTVGGSDPGDDVAILIAANSGMPALPLAKVASGGELARTMLALRLVLSESPPTLIFDEVDAGIGGEAALTVGRSLAALATQSHHQVLVVTHLAQVAAYADAQFAVEKRENAGVTRTALRALDDEARVVELSRMLSGLTSSESARVHAKELLTAARERGRPGRTARARAGATAKRRG